MRKVIMYCDRCKKEFEKWNHKQEENIGVGEVIYDDSCDPYLDCQKDLCKSCYTELVNWWNYKPKSEWQLDHEILKAYSDSANDMLNRRYAKNISFC